ncbi:1-phosphofructokinase [Clostridium tagluense]|uniref:1-phosphofructokinase n=1 Tax=Clostridium tagluense TaxID=360422 RepID=UPI001C0D1850|nr:1-phosphofructokinase [Clostridium tagluense]MBU3130316.1 1-phosphofructokinase [Clostridium tagluense]MCB2313609.1 1-phosphofructokinase [Clostridium tagluense]MCB2318490.1 1-phosphofructokinase [Clostridium tagluense]MCB2323274.1 1-phosphofructokinase [Clostridium tagluense]MCB2328217.1 1-phosphofructokinase [Clostridium tagluense]
MIITVTLNPALDKTIEIDGFKIDTVNRIVSTRVDAGGKGINVSKVIKELKHKSIALGFLGGSSGNQIKNYLDDSNIDNNFLTVKGETRTNLKIFDKVNNTHTDINENGPSLGEKDITNIKQEIMEHCKEDSIVVLSGSVPSGVSTSIYADIIKSIKTKGGKVILDAEGQLLMQGIKAGPYMVKPNIDELEKAFDISINSEDEVIETAKKILEYGVKYVVISLGSKGSIFISDHKVAKVTGIKVEVKSTVGAGDSMVAAMAVAVQEDYSFEQAIKLACATSTANVMTKGTQTGRFVDIEKLKKEIDIKYITKG